MVQIAKHLPTLNQNREIHKKQFTKTIQFKTFWQLVSLIYLNALGRLESYQKIQEI